SNSNQGFSILVENRFAALVPAEHKSANLFIDGNRSLFAVVTVLRDLAPEENLLFLFAERHRTKRGHAELADHLARQFGSLLDIVTSARCDSSEEQFFSQTTTHHDSQLPFEIGFGICMPIVDR